MKSLSWKDLEVTAWKRKIKLRMFEDKSNEVWKNSFINVEEVK
jgi:hypothetical protein